jgi:hypothetical protein
VGARYIRLGHRPGHAGPHPDAGMDHGRWHTIVSPDPGNAGSYLYGVLDNHAGTLQSASPGSPPSTGHIRRAQQKHPASGPADPRRRLDLDRAGRTRLPRAERDRTVRDQPGVIVRIQCEFSVTTASSRPAHAAAKQDAPRLPRACPARELASRAV